MKISSGKPPNNIYDRCREKFGVNWDDGVVFTYGDTIYCKYDVPADIQAHEAVHIRQQALVGKDIWWERYLADKDFRLSQEVEAYKEQWKYLVANADRNYRKMMKKHILDSMVRMYDGMVTLKEAEALVIPSWFS